ncbi:E3 ubiquitin-protein ligase upl3 [Sarracenia purpurea var. burkii]
MFAKGSLFKKSPFECSGKQENSNGKVTGISAREKLLNDQPELLRQYGMDLLPVIIQIYGFSVNGPVRHKCLSVIGKLMYFSSADMIQTLINATNLSSFLAGVLSRKDPQVLVPALQIAQILMEKLPGTFSKMFVREGVVHAVDALILAGSSYTPTQPSSSEKDNDSISRSSSRRRYRQHSGNSNADLRSTEVSRNSVPVIGSPPSSVEIPTSNSSLRMAVSACAKVFKDKYFPSNPEVAEVGVTNDLLNLKNLCLNLNAIIDDRKAESKGKQKEASWSHVSDISASKEENLVGVISEILAELSKGDGASTFEFIGSGVVATLLNYLSCGYFSKERISEAHRPQIRQQAIRRYKAFIEIALSSSIGDGSLAPMSVIVQKLQNALSSLERFPVVSSHSSRTSSGNAHLSSGLSTLSQPIKLRLCRAQVEKSLRDYSSNVVLIDLLATLTAAEDFLWPRVQRSKSGQKSLSAANY